MRALLPVVVLLLALPAGASAWSITTPSKNISCGDLPGGKVQCLVFESTWARRDCTQVKAVGYGTVGRRGRARVAVGCFGGLPFDPGRGAPRILRYGKSTTHRGVTCTSRKSGLRCRNRSGHGFTLSRARGRRF